MRPKNYNLPKVSRPTVISLLTLFLTLASLLVVFHNAVEEPFAFFRTNEILIQVGASCALFLLWLQLAIGIIYGIATGRLSAWFLLILLWGCLVCSTLRFAMLGYIEDIQGFAHLRT